MKRAAVLIFIVVLFSINAVYALGMRRDFMNTPPPPQLVYPTSETADISGKDYLDFKWIVIDPMEIDYCELRLYKGYNDYGDDLILKEQVFSPDKDLRVKADTFNDGQVYTWVLKEVSYGGQKSDTVFNSFRIIKNPK